MAKLKLECVNPETGKVEYFYPLELTPDTNRASRESININNYQVGWVKVGVREFEAALIPVEKPLHDDFIQKELEKQEEDRLAKRCMIEGKRGFPIRCPRQIPNPAYEEGSSEPKHIENRCENCPIFQSYNCKSGREVLFSQLTSTDEDGEPTCFDPVSPTGYYEANRYEGLSNEFVDFVQKRNPRCAELAKLLVKEYSQAESAEEEDKSSSTINSQTKILRELVIEFLQTIDAPS